MKYSQFYIEIFSERCMYSVPFMNSQSRLHANTNNGNEAALVNIPASTTLVSVAPQGLHPPGIGGAHVPQ